MPNLESIRKVYDIAFAPGLDKFLESDQAKWFAREGFPLLVANRPLLGQVLAYLTLVSNHTDAPLGENATLASQEARVTWALLSLCVRSEHDGGEEADKLARRCKALEALLTGEPVTTTTASLADFVHQDENEPEVKGSAFDRQLAKRSEDFWKLIQDAAASQDQGDQGISATAQQSRPLLDGMENRDIIYSIMLLRSKGNGEPSSERELAKRFLESEASGRATNQVFGTIAGMALRAFEA